MEKIVPYEKLSKKEKRKLDLSRRQTWGEINPVTRKPVNSKAYNRNKTRNWKREYHESRSGFVVPGGCVIGENIPAYHGGVAWLNHKSKQSRRLPIN